MSRTIPVPAAELPPSRAYAVDTNRLATARLMLLFTPELVSPGLAPLEVLESVLPHVDAIQVRIKGNASEAPLSAAGELVDWTRKVLSIAGDVPVLVNDRVDVARALLQEGCSGVHLGQDDMDPRAARALLGPEVWIGLSTHSPGQVLAADDLPIDYLGFGPVFATATKGYARGLGPEAAWIATEACPKPIFPIGGITPLNAQELERVGRAAVSSSILQVEDPAAAAATLRQALSA